MTSSGTYNFSLSIADGVLAAFERCGIRAPDLRQEHMLSARRETNLLLTEWSNRQVNLWKVELLSVTLTEGTDTYALPARVIMVLDAYVSLNNGDSDQTDRYLGPISRTDYASYAQKKTSGQPTSYWFDRTITPSLTTYPVADADSTYVINYYAAVQMQDANLAGGETPDIPYRWGDALVAGLAWRMARIYAQDRKKDLKEDYTEAYGYAAEQDAENVPVRFSLGIGRYYR